MGRRRRSNLPPGLSTFLGGVIIFAAANSIKEFTTAYYILLGLSVLVCVAAIYQYIRRNG
ncbi:hypothetical protein HUK80_09420 [Flavobacterium sp. MAH-1]|uniref:Uncharacterized protein n=1 Tax=Flavobacterium agri TaxID=2743471 RepID=A0A7Y8Y2C6_9FLAO|nr:hypothetical protein [Flavobacterium agri]NUY81113.1 hypothetical protein [Flavobacterium agri]NYA71137.1 hypothetical protein [Flavobacterium agri]